MAGETAAPTANGATTNSSDGHVGRHPASPVAVAEAITASAAVSVGPAAAAPVVDKQPMGAHQRGAVGSSLVIATLLLMTQLLAIWPAVIEAVTRTIDDNGNVLRTRRCRTPSCCSASNASRNCTPTSH